MQKFSINTIDIMSLQLFACSVDSPQVHQAWVNAPATELDEADGLGRMPPFPLLGDKGGGPGGQTDTTRPPTHAFN